MDKINRSSLMKQYLMGSVQPELFHIIWGKKEEHYVFIWSHIYTINKSSPTIDECKRQGQRIYNNDYGFMIFDETGNIVSDTGFCILLPKGKYYAVHYKCSYSNTQKVSFNKKKIPFEVKDSDVYLYVEETTRHYVLNVKFELAEWKEVTARYYITQECAENDYRYYDLPNYDSTNRIASLFEYDEAHFKPSNNDCQYQNINENIIKATDDDNEFWETKWKCISAPDILLLTGYMGVNDYYTNTLSKKNNIKLHKESNTNRGQKLKVKFDIIEDNYNYQCIDYSIDYVCSSKIEYIDYPYPETLGENVYERILVSADKTWIATNGFFAETEDGLYRARYAIQTGEFIAISNNNQSTSGTINLLQIGRDAVDGNLKIDDNQLFVCNWDGDKRINLYENSYGVVMGHYYPTSTPFVNECYLNNRPEVLDSYVGDEWHINNDGLADFYANPVDDKYRSFSSYNNRYDKKLFLSNDEIKKIYESEEEITAFDDLKISYYDFENPIDIILPNNNTNMPYRPFINNVEMSQAGYNISKNTYVSLYSDWDFCYEYRKYDDSSFVIVHYTPIRNDGYVLSKQQIKMYLYHLSNETKQFAEENKDNSNYSTSLYDRDHVTQWDDLSKKYIYTSNLIILYVDTNIFVTEDEVTNYYNGIYSDNIKEIIATQNKFKEKINNIQKKFNELYLEDNPNVDLSKINRWTNSFIDIK